METVDPGIWVQTLAREKNSLLLKRIKWVQSVEPGRYLGFGNLLFILHLLYAKCAPLLLYNFFFDFYFLSFEVVIKSS